jgi:hypothetical protein
MRLQHALDLAERILEGALHEDLSQHLGHQHLAPLRRREDAVPAARRALGEVDGPDHPGLGLDELEHVLLVEGMIAQGHHVGARLEDELRVIARQPRPVRGILAVDHDEIEPPVPAQPGKGLCHGGAPGAAHDVSEEEYAHGPGMNPAGGGGKGVSRRIRDRRAGRARAGLRPPSSGPCILGGVNWPQAKRGADSPPPPARRASPGANLSRTHPPHHGPRAGRRTGTGPGRRAARLIPSRGSPASPARRRRGPPRPAPPGPPAPPSGPSHRARPTGRAARGGPPRGTSSAPGRPRLRAK